VYSTITVSPDISQPPGKHRGQATALDAVLAPGPALLPDVIHPVAQRRQGRLGE